MSYYRKKPVVIEAMQWDGSWDSMDAINARWPEMRTTHLDSHSPSRTVRRWGIGTLEGYHQVSVGDFIIKGVRGEFYPCKPDIFALTYESSSQGEQASKRAPLTEEQLDRVIEKHAGGEDWSDDEYDDAVSFARAIEAAHGIKE